MNRLLGMSALFLLLAGASAADDDPVKARLDKAKAAYEAEVEKARQLVLDSLARREEAARKDGNKKLVDQVKAEREAFEESGDLPKATPLTVRQRFTSARSTLEVAYRAAIKEYTRAKKDDEAGVLEKELEALKAGGLGKVPAAGGDGPVALVCRKGGKQAVVSESAGRDGPQVRSADPRKDGKAHLWRVVPAEGGWVYLATADGDRVLGPDRGGSGNGTEIVVAARKPGPAAASQQWKAVPVENGFVKFVNRASGKAFGVDRDSPDAGLRLLLWEDNGHQGEHWQMAKAKGP